MVFDLYIAILDIFVGIILLTLKDDIMADISPALRAYVFL